MSEDELLDDLHAACATGDNERAHSDADAILCKALRHLGWTRLADAFEKESERFWYA